MADNPRRANGTRRNSIRGWLRAQHRPCWICQAFGRPGVIDYSLPAGHPFSFEVDELIPVSKGGSPFSRSNVDAVHRCCNQWRSNKSVEEVMALAHGELHGGRALPEVESVVGRVSPLCG